MTDHEDGGRFCQYPGCRDERGTLKALRKGETMFCSAHGDAWPFGETWSQQMAAGSSESQQPAARQDASGWINIEQGGRP